MAEADVPSIPGFAPDLPEGMPASAQRVYQILSLEGPLTHQELVELSGMPPRTVRYAVARLKDEGLLGQRPNLMDSRQSFFFIDGAPSTAG